MNEIAKRNDTYAHGYTQDDPYGNFANEGGPVSRANCSPAEKETGHLGRRQPPSRLPRSFFLLSRKLCGDG